MGAARRDEMCHRAGVVLLQMLPDPFQRMDDQALVENTENRAAQADRRTGRTSGVRFEQQAGAAVVEQDAALAIAHQHALFEFRHQRGQAVLLLFETRIGLLDAHRHLALQRAMGLGKGIQGRAQPAHVAAAGEGHAVRGVDPVDDADLLAQADHHLRVGRQPQAQEHAERDQQQPGEHHQQRDASGHQREYGGTLLTVQVGPQQPAGERQQAAEQQTEDG
ncbi:hypothetical protein D9M68_626250 [compost metagenome]